MIGLCSAAGDRARALRAHHVCAATFERELGIEPSPATRAVYEAVLDAAPGGAGAAAGTSPFVGHVDELARLRGVWREAAAGRAQLVLVSGEPGIGEARLLDELCARAEAATVEARAYAAEGTTGVCPGPGRVVALRNRTRARSGHIRLHARENPRRGNFGIVTELDFRLHPLGPTVLAGLMMFPIDRAQEVMRSWRDCADAAPDLIARA